MQVVILCGGAGTRLAELTEIQPKPMVPIGGKPILWHIMKLYSHYGYNEFVLALGYKGDQIRSYFANYYMMNSDLKVDIGTQHVEVLEPFHEEKKWSVVLAETGDQTPTGGRLKAVEKYLTGDRFMVTYGDGVSNVDLGALEAFHGSHGKAATVTGMRPFSRWGELGIEGDLVSEFREKPVLREGWVSGGFFVFERRVLDLLRSDSALEREPLERLAKERELAVFRHDGFWYAMDTLRDMRALNEQWAGGNAPWKVWRYPR